MINYALIGKTLLHPTAAAILECFGSRSVLSPKQLALALDAPLANVSYHVGMLAGTRPDSKFVECPILELVDTIPRRGAVEHLYRLTRAGRLS